MRAAARAALIVLFASGLAWAAASRVNVVRRSALEAKSRTAIAVKPAGKTAPTLAAIRAAALASFEQEKRSKGAPRSLLALSPAVAVAIQGAFPTPTPGCATPKITQVSAAPPLDPGDEVILNGCGFGAGGGSELRLVGNFPGGYAKFKASVWHDDAIKAVLDPSVRGAFDQNAQMQVVRGDLKLSNQVPIAFRAAREVVLFEEKNTINGACGGDKSGGHFNQCRVPFQGPGLSIPMPDSFTMGGVHWVNDGDLDNEGTDVLSLSLANGWKTCGYGWEWWFEYPGTGYADAPQGYADHRTSLTLKMNWGFTRDGMQYHVDVYAMGPAGTPYH